MCVKDDIEGMCLTRSDNSKTNNKYYGKCKSYVTLERLWKILYDQGVIDTRIHKSKYQMFPEVLKLRLRGTKLKKCTI